MSKINYRKQEFRPDLQIARAIAVLCVLFFHLDVPPFRGGFIGVDVFFVLSGYFIARTLLANGETIGVVEILTFYNRRIRRILPMALFICLLALLLAPFVLPAVELKELTKQALASAVGVPNILFFEDRSYFQETLFRPMLHFWSLGVEYQYYALFPFLFLMIQRFRYLGPFIWIASFILCVLVSLDSPKTAFYWMPMRIWEFMFGFYALRFEGKIGLGPKLRTQISCFAVSTIIFTALFYSKETLFPGWAAAVPALATFVLIVCGLPEAKGFFKIPSAFLVWVGTLSFSIYLWHYPVLWAFTYQPFIYYPNPSLIQAGAIMGITLLLSVISYKYIEEPFRSPKRVSNKTFYAGVALIFLLMVILAFFYQFKNFVIRPYSNEQKMALYAIEDRRPYRCDDGGMDQKDFQSCLLGEKHQNPVKKVLLAGDSHADSIRPAFVSAAKDKDTNFYLMKESYNPGQSVYKAEYFIEEIEARGITDFVFHGLLVNKETYPELLEIIQFGRQNDVRIHIIDQTPEFDVGIPTDLYTKANKGHLSRERYRENNRKYFEWKRKVREEFPEVRFYDVESILCPEQCSGILNNKVLYFDSHHLTISGAMLLVPIIEDIYRAK